MSSCGQVDENVRQNDCLLKWLARTGTDINLWPSELMQIWIMLFVTN